MTEKKDDLYVIPVRQEITVLEVDKPKEMKLGWKVHEPTEEESKKQYEDFLDMCKNNDTVAKYRGRLGAQYEKPDVIGSTVIRVLPFLNGKKLDNLAMSYIHSLRPSVIRVTNGFITLDARNWRVTVMLEKDDETIKYIEQEVDIANSCGYDLNRAFIERYGHSIK